jgi:hypothetical protein
VSDQQPRWAGNWLQRLSRGAVNSVLPGNQRGPDGTLQNELRGVAGLATQVGGALIPIPGAGLLARQAAINIGNNGNPLNFEGNKSRAARLGRALFQRGTFEAPSGGFPVNMSPNISWSSGRGIPAFGLNMSPGVNMGTNWQSNAVDRTQQQAQSRMGGREAAAMAGIQAKINEQSKGGQSGGAQRTPMSNSDHFNHSNAIANAGVGVGAAYRPSTNAINDAFLTAQYLRT